MTNYYYDTYFSLHTRGKVAENNDASHSDKLRKEFILFKYRFIYRELRPFICPKFSLFIVAIS